MLTIRNLQVEYKKEFPVLKGIDLSMESGKIHGLVGLNGAGKTTLLNTLYSFIRPSAGSVSYNDRSLKRLDIAYLEAENYFLYFYTNLEIFIRVFVYFTISDVYYFYRLIIIFTFNLNDIDGVFWRRYNWVKKIYVIFTLIYKIVRWSK